MELENIEVLSHRTRKYSTRIFVRYFLEYNTWVNVLSYSAPLSTDAENTTLTERHLVDEAEVTIHHLGLGKFRGRVHCEPVEAVCPHSVTEKSWVICRRSLNNTTYSGFVKCVGREKNKHQNACCVWKSMKKSAVTKAPNHSKSRSGLNGGYNRGKERYFHNLTTNTSPVVMSLSTTNKASLCPPILALWPSVRVNQPAWTQTIRKTPSHRTGWRLNTRTQWIVYKQKTGILGLF